MLRVAGALDVPVEAGAVEQTFAEMDTDKDGSLSPDELPDAEKEMDKEQTIAKWQKQLQRAAKLQKRAAESSKATRELQTAAKWQTSCREHAVWRKRIAAT